MPRVLINHFREIEVKIVSEIAWQIGSPVIEIIKDQLKLSNGGTVNEKDAQM